MLACFDWLTLEVERLIELFWGLTGGRHVDGMRMGGHGLMCANKRLVTLFPRWSPPQMIWVGTPVMASHSGVSYYCFSTKAGNVLTVIHKKVSWK